MSSAVFETLRTYDGAPALLDEHLARLQADDPAQLKRAVLERLAAERADVIVRIVGEQIELYPLPEDPGPDVAAATVDVPGYAYPRKFVDRSVHDRLLEQARTFDVIIHDAGEVVEGARTNVFALIEDALITPPLGRCLPGVTRSAVIAIAPKLGLEIVQRPLTLDELTAADELLLTNSVRGVKRVSTLDGREVGGRAGRVQAELEAALLDHYRGAA